MSGIDPGLYRRVLRREQHSSRSGSAVVVLVLLTLLVGYVGVEAVYAALGRRALLFSPVDVLATLTSSVDGGGTSGLVLGAGVVAAIVGLVLIGLAVTPGRRGRHTIDDDRVAVVVDDRVIASSLARAARVSGRLSDQQVSAWVSRRRAQIDLTPASGLAVDEQSVEAATRSELESVAYRPELTARVRTTDTGRVGA